MEGSPVAGMFAWGDSHLDAAIVLDESEDRVLDVGGADDAAATRDAKLAGELILLSVKVQFYETGTWEVSSCSREDDPLYSSCLQRSIQWRRRQLPLAFVASFAGVPALWFAFAH